MSEYYVNHPHLTISFINFPHNFIAVVLINLIMRKNIVLAEDDEDDQMFFKEAISEISKEIHLQIKDNGAELMATLNSTLDLIPDIIFVDLNMPIKDGFTCLQEIRINEKFKNCSVIVLTTSNNPEHIELAYHYGATLYISKPNNFHELKSVLADILYSDLTDPYIITESRFRA